MSSGIGNAVRFAGFFHAGSRGFLMARFAFDVHTFWLFGPCVNLPFRVFQSVTDLNSNPRAYHAEVLGCTLHRGFRHLTLLLLSFGVSPQNGQGSKSGAYSVITSSMKHKRRLLNSP